MAQTVVALLSGGLDSTTMVYWLKNRGYDVKPLYVDYGSKHKAKELEAAQITCKKLGLSLFQLKFDLTTFSNSALTDKTKDVPDTLSEAADTVVPFRNMLLTTLGAIYADSCNTNLIAISPTKEDFEVYRDCRRVFFTQMESTLKMGSKTGGSGYEILTPFIDKVKGDVIKMGVTLKVPFEDTYTCYKGGTKPCGTCPSCLVRAKGFTDAGIEDPLFSTKTVKPVEVKKKAIVPQSLSSTEPEIEQATLDLPSDESK